MNDTPRPKVTSLYLFISLTILILEIGNLTENREKRETGIEGRELKFRLREQWLSFQLSTTYIVAYYSQFFI